MQTGELKTASTTETGELGTGAIAFGEHGVSISDDGKLAAFIYNGSDGLGLPTAKSSTNLELRLIKQEYTLKNSRLMS